MSQHIKNEEGNGKKLEFKETIEKKEKNSKCKMCPFPGAQDI